MKKKIMIICMGILLAIPFLSTTVTANEPPATPTINGSTIGKSGASNNYTFRSVDPDNDNVYYMVSWGCCESGPDYHMYGPFESGNETTIVKTYNEAGTYVISAYAMDVYMAKSETGVLAVSMVENRIFIFPFLRFLENHPRMFPLLQGLLKLNW